MPRRTHSSRPSTPELLSWGAPRGVGAPILSESDRCAFIIPITQPFSLIRRRRPAIEPVLTRCVPETTLVDPTGFDAKNCPTDGGCGGNSAQGTPEQSSWSCYGDCGSGWANSLPGAGSTPDASMLALAGGLIGINDFASAFNNAVPNSPSQYNNSADTPQGDPSQGGQPTSEVTVTGTPPGVSSDANGFYTVTVCAACVAQVELPPGLEIFIEGQKVNRLPPTYTPEQPMDPVPRGPVQSPVNPPTTPPVGRPGWLWWQMLQLFLGVGWAAVIPWFRPPLFHSHPPVQ